MDPHGAHLLLPGQNFEPRPPGYYHGKFAEYIQESAHDPFFQENRLWCAQHWAPCPVHDKDGVMASQLLATMAVALMPKNLTAPAAQSRWLAGQRTPICCQLGNQVVAAIWKGEATLEAQ